MATRGGWQGVELVVVFLIVIVLLRIANQHQYRFGWMLPWIIMVGASVLPNLIRGERLSGIGIRFGDPLLSLRWVGLVCLIFYPMVIIVYWYCSQNGIVMPLIPEIMKEQYVFWGLYQFLYVGVSEELFFRGYIQSRIREIIMQRQVKERSCVLMSLLISSMLFGIAHVAVNDQWLSAVTFFPGLIFGWLFIRTRSLIAPVLFHGLSNCLYGGLSVLFH